MTEETEGYDVEPFGWRRDLFEENSVGNLFLFLMMEERSGGSGQGIKIGKRKSEKERRKKATRRRANIAREAEKAGGKSQKGPN